MNPISEQNARHAIDAAIEYGRTGINKPPTEDHWLMPYWLIGQQLTAHSAQPAQEQQPVAWPLPQDWRQLVARAYCTWREHDHTTPDDVLDLMRDILYTAAPAKPAEQEKALTLRESADTLIEAGHEFWSACSREAGGGAVRWLDCSDDTLVIFTRGEYRDTLLAGVHKLPGIPTICFSDGGDEDAGRPSIDAVAKVAEAEQQAPAITEQAPHTDIARRNLRAFLGRASFSSAVDRQAALSCLDEIEIALAANPVVRPWVRLSDAEWVNIVNHGHAYENFDKEEAVHEAVKRTEAKLKELNSALRSEQAPAGEVPRTLGIEELEIAWNAQADRYNQWSELGLDEIVHFAQEHFVALSAPPAVPHEPCAPHILEALSYHGRERDDLTLEEAVEAFRHGYKKVRQREDRAMLAQIIDLLASAPAAPQGEQPQ